ncbi:MAG TPA: EAL domain-containing protein, partial [Methylophilaceae bacterium]|nr:EAL domain-containing protein [Methylophilaceae bacterium]
MNPDAGTPFDPDIPAVEQRLLVMASTLKDSEMASKVLTQADIDCVLCKDTDDLMRNLEAGAAAILLVEEVLSDITVARIEDYLSQQPDWSDLSIMILAFHGADSTHLKEILPRLGKVTLLERPVRTTAFISAVRAAFRGRARQYRFRASQLQLTESEQRFKTLFEYHPDGIFIRDLTGKFISANKALETMLSYTVEELQGTAVTSLVLPEEATNIRNFFEEAKQGNPQKFKTRIRRKNGDILDLEAAYLPLVVNGEIIGVHGIARDVTQAKMYQRQIEHLATHDPLTGLLNRYSLYDRLEHAIAGSRRDSTQVGILFMDLNRFKQINDSLGHDRGDLLLEEIARRLKNSVRDGDTVARLGGDEFVIVMENIQDIEEMAHVSEIILDNISATIHLDGHELSVTTSIGGSVYPKDGDDVSTLLKHADLAMYQAKEMGSSSFRFYDPYMNIKILERLLTENALRKALANDEFVLHYQPRVRMNDKQIVGAEALIRWNNPQQGLIPPVDFIPLAEEIGLIHALGDWVLETACRQNKAWQDAGLPPIVVAVNLSAQQLVASSVKEKVQQVLARTGLDPRYLELEITETSLVQNMETTLETLHEIRDIGVSISIDDFGIGYSSLTHLKRLPVNTLKIDKSFIHDMLDDRDDAAIVTATITLAHQMQLKVIAEGVTSPEEIRFLADL